MKMLTECVRVPREFQQEPTNPLLHTERGAALLAVLRAINDVDPAFVAALEGERSSSEIEGT